MSKIHRKWRMTVEIPASSKPCMGMDERNICAQREECAKYRPDGWDDSFLKLPRVAGCECHFFERKVESHG